MQILVYGASGRVGEALIKTILESEKDSLAAAVVSPASAVKDQMVPGTPLRYAALTAGQLQNCNVAIDFSGPKATMQLIDAALQQPCPIVIGTTGMSDDEVQRIHEAAKQFPIMLGANFAYGFEAFIGAALLVAGAHGNAAARVGEVYHARKKPVPSGTSLRLAKEVGATLGAGENGEAAVVPIDVMRMSDTVGVNGVRFDMGVSEVTVSFEVRTLDAYARGALEAARWLVGCQPGLYFPKDMY